MSLPESVVDVAGVAPLLASRVPELELVLGELHDPDDVDSLGGGSVVASHLVVHLVDGSLLTDVSELLEHVLDSGVGPVLEEDSEVAGSVEFLFVDLLDLDDLSVGLLEFVVSLVEFPEP